jgi:hypothetical protein
VESDSLDTVSMSVWGGGSAVHKKDRSLNPPLEDRKAEDRSRSPTPPSFRDRGRKQRQKSSKSDRRNASRRCRIIKRNNIVKGAISMTNDSTFQERTKGRRKKQDVSVVVIGDANSHADSHKRNGDDVGTSR